MFTQIKIFLTFFIYLFIINFVQSTQTKVNDNKMWTGVIIADYLSDIQIRRTTTVGMSLIYDYICDIRTCDHICDLSE